MTAKTLLCLDVGERRIGVALVDLSIPIPIPKTTIEVDGAELQQIVKLIDYEGARKLVVGYPRNQQGEVTKQTEYVEAFVQRLQATEGFSADVVYQDESLTSVMAEQQLIAQKKPYTKGDIDAHAARIILQDYIERHHG